MAHPLPWTRDILEEESEDPEPGSNLIFGVVNASRGAERKSSCGSSSGLVRNKVLQVCTGFWRKEPEYRWGVSAKEAQQRLEHTSVLFWDGRGEVGSHPELLLLWLSEWNANQGFQLFSGRAFPMSPRLCPPAERAPACPAGRRRQVAAGRRGPARPGPAWGWVLEAKGGLLREPALGLSRRSVIDICEQVVTFEIDVCKDEDLTVRLVALALCPQGCGIAGDDARGVRCHLPRCSLKIRYTTCAAQ